MSDFILKADLKREWEAERDDLRQILEDWEESPPPGMQERLEELNELIDGLRNKR
jgi:hypothetical protein